MENEDENGSYYDRVDCLARWLGVSVAAAFFASLQRCSCVNLTTFDTDDDDETEEAKDRPLVLTSYPSFRSATSFSAAPNNPGVNLQNPPTAVENLPV
ncbi:hypothetical protein AAHA92_13845 [Salvia divinorum]|uniref:Uncharacterized protein n=1 Tax=Salvia divinorum TaxID=28513 RepID=A0ABD1H9M6_SALDI